MVSRILGSLCLDQLQIHIPVDGVTTAAAVLTEQVTRLHLHSGTDLLLLPGRLVGGLGKSATNIRTATLFHLIKDQMELFQIHDTFSASQSLPILIGS